MCNPVLECNNKMVRKPRMKRLLLIAVISVLFMSGWSHVVAAALCPNMQVKTSCPMQMMDHSTSSHDAMEIGEMVDMAMPDTTVSGGEANAVDPPMGSCPHCFSQSEHPTSTVVAVKAVDQSKRDLRVILHQSLTPIASQASSFARPVLSRQHAPPRAPTARHILINVFLI